MARIYHGFPTGHGVAVIRIVPSERHPDAYNIVLDDEHYMTVFGDPGVRPAVILLDQADPEPQP